MKPGCSDATTTGQDARRSSPPEPGTHEFLSEFSTRRRRTHVFMKQDIALAEMVPRVGPGAAPRIARPDHPAGERALQISYRRTPRQRLCDPRWRSHRPEGRVDASTRAMPSERSCACASASELCMATARLASEASFGVHRVDLHHQDHDGARPASHWVGLAGTVVPRRCARWPMAGAGVYKPVWHIEDEESLTLVLANAQHIRNVPHQGGEIDAAHGLTRFAAGPERDLTRTGARSSRSRCCARHPGRQRPGDLAALIGSGWLIAPRWSVVG